MSTEIVKASEVRLPKFVEDAYDTIEGMKQFAGMLLDSKLVPDHFYEKGVDNKPDYAKGKVPAVVVVLLQAQQLAIPPMTALQHVIPVNGLLSIKGDLAKTMIFASGKLRKDSWQETVTGTIEEENMVVTITATREDNGVSLTRSFSVDKAKRMGLWITSAQINGSDGWKWKKSAWYKTPDRMLNYRALGNIARDLFSDVLLNMYTTEEAQDIGKETTEVIETESGAKITIPDKEHAQKRSGKMTDRVADKIPDNKFGAVSTTIQDATVINEPEKFKFTEPMEDNTGKEGDEVIMIPKNPNESPFIPSKESVEYFKGKKIERNEDGSIKEDVKEEIPGQYTLEGMEKMDTPILLKIVMEDMDMMEASQMIPGKNTNLKLRKIIFAHQEGKLAEHVAPYLSEGEGENKNDITPNKDFDKKLEDKQKEIDNFLDAPVRKEETSGNKYGITISEFNKGESRDFAETKTVFNQLAGVTPSINALRYLELAGKKGILIAFPDKETFCKNATVKMINELLDIN